MKLWILSLLICLPSFFQSESKVEWVTPLVHDFGDIPHKVPAKFSFQFKNTSSEPLLIDNVRTGCGCTAPDWSYDATPVDSIGTINIIYDAKKMGFFSKKIKVFFNGQRKAEKLLIEGYVEDFE